MKKIKIVASSRKDGVVFEQLQKQKSEMFIAPMPKKIADEIVKAVNMHEEMIKILDTIIDRLVFKEIFPEEYDIIIKLLKKAEQ